ncbi:TetR/AcrR family transcriptional regulator [Ramlibacter sp.]|uniref:TetR/AcrR family transcriptional regulator n=1 Tax=Ramlibacter sp. TaxID=1917967 RepID=UPI00181F1D5E|nr:TetR/AcrR family transcriptional regulator [Ramlibacter sp.]MBA2673835.1 TetR/AcrR family transcriptional regulator [Ramlibacter sp.]
MGSQGAERAKPRWNEPVAAMKRDAILAAARAVFEEHGLDQASMRVIAARAGCTTGAVYPLFASKEHIYAALLEQSLAALHERVAAAHARARVRPHEAAAKAFAGYYLERPYEVNLGLYAFDGLKRLGVGKESDRTLNDALAATVRLLSPRPPKTRSAAPDAGAMAVFAQLIGMLVLHLSGRLTLGNAGPAEILNQFFIQQRAAQQE